MKDSTIFARVQNCDRAFDDVKGFVHFANDGVHYANIFNEVRVQLCSADDALANVHGDTYVQVLVLNPDNPSEVQWEGGAKAQEYVASQLQNRMFVRRKHLQPRFPMEVRHVEDCHAHVGCSRSLHGATEEAFASLPPGTIVEVNEVHATHGDVFVKVDFVDCSRSIDCSGRHGHMHEDDHACVSTNSFYVRHKHLISPFGTSRFVTATTPGSLTATPHSHDMSRVPYYCCAGSNRRGSVPANVPVSVTRVHGEWTEAQWWDEFGLEKGWFRTDLPATTAPSGLLGSRSPGTEPPGALPPVQRGAQHRGPPGIPEPAGLPPFSWPESPLPESRPEESRPEPTSRLHAPEALPLHSSPVLPLPSTVQHPSLAAAQQQPRMSGPPGDFHRRGSPPLQRLLATLHADTTPQTWPGVATSPKKVKPSTPLAAMGAATTGPPPGLNFESGPDRMSVAYIRPSSSARLYSGNPCSVSGVVPLPRPSATPAPGSYTLSLLSEEHPPGGSDFLPNDVLVIKVRKGSKSPAVVDKLKNSPGLSRRRPPREDDLRPSGEQGPWCFVNVDVQSLLDCVDNSDRNKKAFYGGNGSTGANGMQFREYHVLIYWSEWQLFNELMAQDKPVIKVNPVCIFAQNGRTTGLASSSMCALMATNTPDWTGMPQGHRQAVSANLPLPPALSSHAEGLAPQIAEKIHVMRIRHNSKKLVVTDPLHEHEALDQCRGLVRETYRQELQPRGISGPWCFAPLSLLALDKLEAQFADAVRHRTQEFRKGLGLKDGQEAKFKEYHVLLFCRDKQCLEDALDKNIEDTGLTLLNTWSPYRE